jgi:hypothetical protein
VRFVDGESLSEFGRSESERDMGQDVRGLKSSLMVGRGLDGWLIGGGERLPDPAGLIISV